MNDIFERAVKFAFKAHSGQVRRDGSMFILHPLEDAAIVGTMTNDVEVLSAAVLHDTIEDTSVTIEEIKENFGEKIANYILSETENKHKDMSESESWKIRKEESLLLLKNGPKETKMLWLGDKLSNLRAIARGYEKVGLGLFDAFNQNDPYLQRWYYKSILDYTSDLKEYGAYKEYENLYHYIFDALE